MVSLKLNADASQAKEEVQSYTERIKEMNAQLAESNKIGDFGQSVKLTQGIEALTNAQKQYMQMANHSISQQVQAQNNGGMGNTVVNTANNASNAVSTLSSGNFAGAAIQASRGMGNNFRQWGANLAKENGGATGLTQLLGGLGIAGMGAGAAMAAGNALSNQYENSLGSMTDFQRRYGERIGEKSAAENAKSAMDFFTKSTQSTRDTGLSQDDFLTAAGDLARYGIASGDRALDMTRQAALKANATGADLTALQNLQGIAARYGDNSNVLKTANQGLYATGMQKGQFDEFLHGLQTVIEDGISNGYVKSTEDVTKELTMYARLSGNAALWTGEQGAKRLSQMDGAISGAVNMQSASDMIVATTANNILGKMTPEQIKNLNAFNVKDTNGNSIAEMNRYTGTYVDSMLLMENGVSTDMLRGIGQSVQAMEGNNIAGQIERYKDIFKLNYAGAVDVYNMMKDTSLSDEELNTKIKAMQEDSKYQSDETRKQNALNDIKNAVVNLGKNTFSVKYDGMGKTAGITQKIYDWLAKDNAKKAKDNAEKPDESYGGNKTIQAEMKNRGKVASPDYTTRMEGIKNNLRHVNVYSAIPASSEQHRYYLNFANDNMGDEKKDEALLKTFEKYGVDNPRDIKDVLMKFNGINAVSQAYDNGTVDMFISKLEALLNKLNFVVQE